MKLMNKEDKFWAIVDDYEAGDITLTDAMQRLVELNDGDEAAAEEDLRLLLKK